MATPSKTKPKQEVITRETQVIDASEVGMIPANLGERRALSAAAQAFLDEAKGKREVPNKVPIIGIDHKEAIFVLPSGDRVNKVSGFPVYYYQTRRYYAKPPRPGEKGNPPDCWSPDLIRPDSSSRAKQAEMCANCPQAQFGSARDGRSQACGSYTWVFLMNPEFGSPPLAVIPAPPSSIRRLLGTRFEAGYFARCAAKHDVYEIVWSTFFLEQAGDQVPYCVLDPRMGPAAAEVDQVKRIVACRNQFLEAFERMRGMTPEATADGSE